TRFGGIARGYADRSTSVTAEGPTVAKWGNWHCGADKARFDDAWAAEVPTLFEAFVEGEAVRIPAEHPGRAGAGEGSPMSGMATAEALERLRAEVARHPYPLVFATVSGAHLYGFPSPDSDYDLRGCHVLPLREVVGLDTGRETVETTAEE